ncbi:MAG: lycopene cyclase [Deinococcales bacterium]|nr:lycopene cyclase [Chitinophagaceae bacterium]
MRLLQQPSLNQKKILVLDQAPKTKNDRTWCFWEKQNGMFEPIIHHRWQEINFLSNQHAAQLNIAPYTYKMLHGIKFYNYVINYAKQFANVEFRYEKVIAVDTKASKATVVLANETLTADYVFNSIIFRQPQISKGKFYLLQHFKGWVIETKTPSFNPNVATFMDFTVSQQHGTTFMYVLPTSTTEALVEYTLFTNELLQQSDYENALKLYIADNLKITDYTIKHEEFGIIPMTNISFAKHKGKVINIGIAGGQAKGSSGYAFQFIQKRTEQIVNSLVKYNHPFTAKTLAAKKFHLYDSVLLHVLHHKKLPGDTIFANIFKKNTPKTIFKFLDNESNLLEDLQIMISLPTSVFLKAAMQELFK